MCILQNFSKLPSSRHSGSFFKFKTKKSLLILADFRLVVSSEHDLEKKLTSVEEHVHVRYTERFIKLIQI